MDDLIGMIKDLNTYWKETLALTSVLGSFWTIPFMLFKPDFFNFPIYAQLALIFALTITWLISTLLSSSHIFNRYINPQTNPVRLGVLIAIILLNVSILISYYYSVSFTGFLRYSAGVLVTYFLVVLIIFIISDVRNEK